MVVCRAYLFQVHGLYGGDHHDAKQPDEGRYSISAIDALRTEDWSWARPPLQGRLPHSGKSNIQKEKRKRRAFSVIEARAQAHSGASTPQQTSLKESTEQTALALGVAVFS